MRHPSARSILLTVAGLALVAGTSLFCASPAQAQDDNESAEQTQDSATQPTVGRVSVIRGNVSIQRGDSGDWVAATLNTPVMAGDRISTGNGARAEIQLDYADVLRLDENSSVKITDLTNSHIQLQVAEGVAEYAVIAANGTDSEIDTPNAAVHPLREGDYRIEINGDSESRVTVHRGQAEISEPQGSTRVEDGQVITVQGSDSPQYQVENAARTDDFDRWNTDRDHSIESAQSWQHTDRYYTGSEDLDRYGHWVYVADYGQVWVPAQNAGWAPYRDGRWVWEPYYGWTWVSYEPWGWAPYHYGRWFVWDGAWAWWPGPIGVYGGWGYRPIWSPAYVSFFGWGGGVSFGFGFGNIGWLPCGPGDFFTPWWGFGVNRVTFVNVTNINIVNVHNHFRGVGDRRFGRRRFDPLFRGRNGFSNISRFNNDARIRAGVSSVRGKDFGRGDARFQRGVSTPEFRKANFMTGRLPVTPQRQSLGKIQQRVSPGIARTANFNKAKFYSQSRASFTPKPFHEQVSQEQRIIENSRTSAGARMPSTPAQQRFGNTDGARATANSSANSSVSAGRFNPPAQQRPNTSVRQAPNVRQAAPPQPGRMQEQHPSGNQNWRQFTPPAQQQSRPNPPAQQRPNTFKPQTPNVRQAAPPQPGRMQEQPPSGNQNWRQFTPPAQQQSRPNPPAQQRPNTSVRQAPNVRQAAPPQPGRMQEQPPSGNQNWRQFTPPAQQQSRPNPPAQQRPNTFKPQTPNVRQAAPQQPGRTQEQRPSGNQNWRQFTPPAQQQSRPIRPGNNFDRPASPPQSRSGGDNFSRSNARRDRNAEGSRPELNMRQPIATPRNPRSFGGNPGREMPRYSAPRPQQRGSYSAPRGASRPSFGGGGRPSFGGRGGGTSGGSRRGGGSRGGSHPSGGSHRPH